MFQLINRRSTTTLLLAASIVLMPGCRGALDVSLIDPLGGKQRGEPQPWDITLATQLHRPFERQTALRIAYAASVDPLQRRTLRDEIVLTALAWIEEQQQHSRIRFTGVRAANDAASDLAIIGLTSAATLGSGEALKSALAAAASAVAGANMAINERFLSEQTTAAVLAQMDIDHRTAALRILQRLRDQDDANYSLAAADLDLLDCLYAGTLTNAVMSLADEASLRRAAIRTASAPSSTTK